MNEQEQTLQPTMISMREDELRYIFETVKKIANPQVYYEKNKESMMESVISMNQKYAGDLIEIISDKLWR